MIGAVVSAVLLCPAMQVAAPAQDENPLVEQVRAALGEAKGPFVMLIRIEAKPGMGRQLEAAFAPAVAATRREKGCLAYDLVRSAKSADAYVLYERWASG